MIKGASLYLRLRVWLGRTWPFLLIMALAVYFGTMAARSVYKTYQDQQATKDLENQLRQADEEKERLQALLTYYRSESYKEKELRRTLLLRRPGEKVYALPESSVLKQAEEGVAQAGSSNGDAQAAAIAKMPIWRQWVKYLWHLG